MLLFLIQMAQAAHIQLLVFVDCTSLFFFAPTRKVLQVHNSNKEKTATVKVAANNGLPLANVARSVVSSQKSGSAQGRNNFPEGQLLGPFKVGVRRSLT